MNTYHPLLNVLTINNKIANTAKEITQYINNNNITELTIIPVLNGALFFTVDLIRALHHEFIDNYTIDEKPICKLKLESIRTKSYINNSNKGNELTCSGLNILDIKDKIILLVDDVFDSGKTLIWLKNELIKQGAAKVITAVFVNKTCNHDNTYTPDFVSYILNENKFLVGYGMDNNGYDRELRGLYYIP